MSGKAFLILFLVLFINSVRYAGYFYNSSSNYYYLGMLIINIIALITCIYSYKKHEENANNTSE